LREIAGEEFRSELSIRLARPVRNAWRFCRRFDAQAETIDPATIIVRRTSSWPSTTMTRRPDVLFSAAQPAAQD